jgi:MFS transporter, FHS family, glucose/mannose:H+ symporter
MFRKRFVFLAACIGMLLFGIALITLGSVIPDLREKLGINDVSAGILFSILPFGIFSGSLLFGPIVDRYGYRILLAVSCLLLFAGFEGIAYSPSRNLIRFFVLLVGFSGGMINGATNAVVADISDKDKGANLSLLGAFFGIGALGMPLVLGLLKSNFNFEVIVASVGIITLAAGIFFLFIKFPPPKQTQGFPLIHSMNLIKDNVLILIASFLFFQSSFEGIINNWTTTYIIDLFKVKQGNALYALSSFVTGMAVMRLITGIIFRTISEKKLLFISLGLVLLGLTCLRTGNVFYMAVISLFILGAGLACGFPVMLGFTGNRFKELSGTAFSLVLSIGLLGNMLINYGMGLIARNFGIRHLTTVAFVELAALAILAAIIIKKVKSSIAETR